MPSPIRMALRVLVTWLIEAAGLYLMLQFLPGVTVSNWSVAIQAALVIGLLNARVRPAIFRLPTARPPRTNSSRGAQW